MLVFDDDKIPAKLIGQRVRAHPRGLSNPIDGTIIHAHRFGFTFRCDAGVVKCMWDQLVDVPDKSLGIVFTQKRNPLYGSGLRDFRTQHNYADVPNPLLTHNPTIDKTLQILQDYPVTGEDDD